jgi:UDP-2-acetamido-2-deoxy-ribo-hexuluronate aminotransferase
MEFIDLKTPYNEQKSLIQERIGRVLDHGQYILGPEVKELEEKLAAYTGAKHCITVASGTEALLISLMALGVKGGDEVITTPFSFIATAEVIAFLGAVPVFVDIEPDTCNIDVTHIERAITPRTRAIMPVSLYGQPGDMDAINAIASKHGLAVIEDAAQSFGADYQGRKSCNLSGFGCTSFFPSKPLGCYGDGGAIFTSDDALARTCREIRVHGQEKRYYHTRIGVGGRMDTLQCAIVLAKLERFEQEVAARQRIGRRYHACLAPFEESGYLRRLTVRPDRSSVYAQYTIMVERRDHVQAALKAQGIPTAVHYPLPLHRQPALAPLCTAGGLPVSEAMARTVMSLPMHPYLSEAQQDEVVLALGAALST